jgi:hypothetical protein
MAVRTLRARVPSETSFSFGSLWLPTPWEHVAFAVACQHGRALRSV